METRFIKLSLDTAKRWYEQGGELKDMALGAFSEKELIGDGLPKTWDEYCAKHGDMGVIIKASLGTAYVALNKHVFSDYKQTQAHIALMKLHLLRDEYRNGWCLENRDLNIAPYTIFSEYEWDSCHGCYKMLYKVKPSGISSRLLMFQDKETATEFLTNFREFIEEAGDLI